MSVSKRMLWILLCAFGSFAGPLAAGGGSYYKPLTSQEMANYYKQLDAEVQKAGQKVTQIMKDSNEPGHIVSPADRIRLETAATMMEVKKTLAGNFSGAPSLQSPVVREKLLSILKKEVITSADLLELQNVVDKERPKVQEEMTMPSPSSNSK